MNNNHEVLNIEIVSKRLKDYVSPDYKWPELPKGWQVEFIVYPNGEVDMDFLHPVSCAFWSEDNGFIELPFTKENKPITAKILKQAGVPFMTTFGHAVVSEQPKESHLKVV